MARSVQAEININAICDNYLHAKKLANNAKAIAVVKANAYGHGAIKVAQGLAKIADAFGVACIEEAMELKNAGIKQPILLLEGFFTADELNYISEHELWCVIHSFEQLEHLKQSKLVKPIHVWLKMDSGMHRLGFSPSDYPSAWLALNALPQVANIVHMSHFSAADDVSSAVTAQQEKTFFDVVEKLPGDVSLANSAASLSGYTEKQQWIRPGIMLYGASPMALNIDNNIDKNTHNGPLKPAMSLTAKVIAERFVDAGDGVGYNHLWLANKRTKVGTVSIGYADGYPRHAKSGTPVWINGKKSQILGRVSMDMLSVDLSMFEETCVGESVELWGDNIHIETIAQCADTIAYTLFCGLTRRVHKQYI